MSERRGVEMSERSIDERATDPPGAVSDQNGEEAESELRDDQTHPEPRTRRHRQPAAGTPRRSDSQPTSDPGGLNRSENG